MTVNGSKVALVTGASRGIGAAIARRLAHDGFSVVVNYAGNTERAEALVREIESAGGRALALQADVSDPAAVAAMFEAAQAEFGGVDVLVNNAGIIALSPLAETDDDGFDRLVAVNLKGSFNTMREAARRLRTGGRVINFSSSVVGLRQPSYGIYAATKAGIEALTSVLAKELRGRAITVFAEQGMRLVKLGEVTPKGEATLQVPQELVARGGEVRLFVRSAGGTDVATRPLTLRKGDHLSLDIVF